MTSILRAAAADAAAILALQQLAYQSEAQLYQNWNIPPLTQTLDELAADFADKTFLEILDNSTLVGSVRAFQTGETAYIERLIVHPDYQGRGLGSALMNQIEIEFARARRYELFTGHLSLRNLALYERLGYRTFKTQPIHQGLTFVFLEKLK